MLLTDRQCRNAVPRLKIYRLNDGNGLYLDIKPNGSKLWRKRYRYNGKEKTLSFGPYPFVTLAEARIKNNEATKDIYSGINPSAVRQEIKRAAILNAENTFEALAIEWHNHHKSGWETKHGNNILSRLKRNIFPMIGNVPIADLKTRDIAAVIKHIDGGGYGETARRTLQHCSQVMCYAVNTGRAENDITATLKRGFLKRQQKRHYATIDVKKLPELIQKIRGNDVRLFKQTRIALELMMLTFVRTSELINATWDEFNFEEAVWTIPAARMKMRVEHTVPLCRQALALLADLKEISGRRDHLFPSIPRPRKPMSNATLLRALEKLGYRKAMTGHGFRALAMTAIQEKLGYEFSIVDRQLAHRVKGAVNQAYDRAQFLDKRREMMQAWADYIDQAYHNGTTPNLAPKKPSRSSSDGVIQFAPRKQA